MTETELLKNRDLLPKHIAIIMDGNGRWAQQRGKMRVSGHRAGVKSVRAAVSVAARLEIDELTLFAFSSENWRRPDDEVSGLMTLFLTVLEREVKKLDRHGVRLRIIGDTTGFSPKLQLQIQKAEATTASNQGLLLNIAANYGGRWDVSNAVQSLAKQIESGEITSHDITEETINQRIDKLSMSDVDLMIRTGGEHRISNFMLWQMAYAELYFCDTLWPDFGEDCFTDAMSAFINRERRFGCTGEQVQSTAV
ncbi:di-trans,poly-cis-decaprenylcistransferase [Alginatibacterium sediminis]|uniref:Ditrans,polycis-undecaprenyl-diphosphate synthase ((2E,6E)-farnesyl-diphosphate specific) n=1 Tax=Alginatibacterium sediminis TaxID=2164068 RepID=A0A420E870_9ALTE|nr:polyprenyl diphosphate synthase [Alginatibacterium sediminis]RKF15508.1 di-trans,poly-cis-decaprenylcistransferase [Alginatibacterium sediminis]